MVTLRNGSVVAPSDTESVFSQVLVVQSTLVISTSVISNLRLSGRETLVLVLTQKSKIRLQNIVLLLLLYCCFTSTVNI